jgi:hypothetical protein
VIFIRVRVFTEVMKLKWVARVDFNPMCLVTLQKEEIQTQTHIEGRR